MTNTSRPDEQHSFKEGLTGPRMHTACDEVGSRSGLTVNVPPPLLAPMIASSGSVLSGPRWAAGVKCDGLKVRGLGPSRNESLLT